MSSTLAASVARFRATCAGLATPLPEVYNIADAACGRWARSKRTAMIVPERGGYCRRTFADVETASIRLSNGLAALGVDRGDRVAVVLPQSFECGVAHIAIQRMGAIAVPLTTLYGPEALEHRLTSADAKVAIGSWESHGWLAEHELRKATTWLMVGPAVSGFLSFGDVLSSGASRRGTSVETKIDDPALIIFTSGTTGLPKGVLHAQRVVPAHTEPISLAHNGFPKEHDVFWSPADWAWAGGLIDCLFAAWTAGRPIVAWRSRGFDAEAVVDVMEQCGVTNTFLPPTALRLLRDVDDMSRRGATLALRSVMTGGERVGEDIVEWCCETLRLMPNEVFGQTEASCVLGNSYTVLPARPGSVGMEYPRVRVALLNDDGDPVNPGQPGEISIHRSTPAMFVGYWRGGHIDPAAGGVWHRTGDMGTQDEDGYYWHVGRRDDLILSSGYRIGPGEVETCLSRHPGVRTVAVVGTPHAVRGEVVTAVIELRDGFARGEALEKELQSLVRAQLAPYEVPRLFRFVDELPRTETGKIRRAEIMASLMADRHADSLDGAS